MGGTGGGLRGAPVPQRRLGLALLQAGRLRRRRPPGGGGGGLFLPLSRRPGRQEVSARPARCGEPGSWEQPQLDWKPAPGGGRQSVRRVDPRPRVPPLFPAAQAYPSRYPSPHPRLISLVALLSPSCAQVATMLMGLSGSGREGGPCCSPWEPLGPSGVRVGGRDGRSTPRLPPPLFTRRLPPRKLNPPAVILFGNFGQLL